MNNFQQVKLGYNKHIVTCKIVRYNRGSKNKIQDMVDLICIAFVDYYGTVGPRYSRSHPFCLRFR